MSPNGNGVVVRPQVNRIVVCDQTEFAANANRWVISGPWSVRFANPDESGQVHFPVLLAELGVYLELTGGHGSILLGLEVRRKFDFRESPNTEQDFQVHYGEQPVWVGHNGEPCVFLSGQTRLLAYEFGLRLTDLELPEEGTYEFRAVTPVFDPVTGEIASYEPLDGEVSEVFLLDPTRRL